MSAIPHEVNMVLTPERIAELERLKKMYLPLAQEAQRQSQLSQNNERFVPVDKKASGGSMAPLTQLSATDPMLQGDVQPTSNATSLTPAEEQLAQQAAMAATQADLLQGGNSNATTSTATNGSPTGSVVGDIGYSLSAMAPFSVMGLVAQSMMDSMSPTSVTSSNAVNGMDSQSDAATTAGVAPAGSVNGGVSTAPSNDGVGAVNGVAGDTSSSDSAAHGGSIHATRDMDAMRLALMKGGVVSKLRKHGQGVPNELEAMKRMSQGHRVFVVHEQDEHPREVTSVRELAGYAPDQMYTLAPHHEAHGGRITHAHHLEMEERPL